MSETLGQQLRGFFGWWRATLAGSLPSGLRDGWRQMQHRCDFVILHHGDDLLVQNRRGEVVEQLSLLPEAAAEPEMELDFVVGDAVVPLPERREPTDEVMDEEGTQPARDDNTARVIDLSRHRDEITQLIDETGRIDEQALENTQLFFFRDGEIRPLDADSASPEASRPVASEIDFDLGAGQPDLRRERLQAIIRRYLRRGRCRYLLPSQQLLALRLSYPVEVRDNLDNVLRYDLEKHMPLGLDEIHYFAHHWVDRDQERLQVDVEIMKRDDHSALVDDLDELTRRGLDVSTARSHAVHHRNIELQPQAGRRLTARLMGRGSLVWLMLLMILAAALILPYAMLREQGRLRPPVSAERLARAGAIQATSRELQQQARVQEAVATEIGTYPRAQELLALLSQDLGEQAWLSDFRLEGRELRIKGEAESASLVSDDLERSGRFEGIRFISSIIQNASTGKEAFEIGMKVRADE